MGGHGSTGTQVFRGRWLLHTWVCISLLLCGSQAYAFGQIEPTPDFRLTKTVGDVSQLGINRYSIPVKIKLRNVGDVAIDDIRIEDNLVQQIAPASVLDVQNLRVEGGFTQANPVFDGDQYSQVLASGQSLQPGTWGIVYFTLVFANNAEAGPFYNLATVRARNPQTHEYFDACSRRDTKPSDTYGCDPAEFSIPAVLVGLAKAASPAVLQSDGSFTTELTFKIKNYCEVDFIELRLVDNLAEVFGDTSFTVMELSSDILTVNPSFNGVSDLQVLQGTDVLAVGEHAYVSLSVQFDPSADTGVFYNQAVVSSGLGASDQSTNGSNPDPDGNHIPDEADPTPIPFERPPLTPARLGIAKHASAAEVLAGETFVSRFTLTVKNYGQTTAQGVNVIDELNQTFGQTADFEVVSSSLHSDLLTINPEFDGVDQTNLLMGMDELAAGQVATVVFDVQFTVTALTPHTLTNLATVTGDNSPPDDSTPGDDPDPNDDDVPDENGATEIPYEPPVFAAQLGIAKQASEAVAVGEAEFETTFTLRVENFGNATATGVNIEDDLSVVFATATDFSVVAGSLQSTDFDINPGFDGVGNQQLLIGSDTLAPGETGDVTFAVRFGVSAQTESLANLATVNGDNSPPDDSTPGDDPDPNDDDVPDENGATEIPYEPPVFTARLGIAKQASEAVAVGEAEFETTFTLRVENFGNATATGVNIEDDLSVVFTTATDFSVVDGSLQSTDFDINPGFDGLSNQMLLTGTDSLSAGEIGEVSFNVRFTVSSETNALMNLATVTGDNSPPDDSTPGDDPDPNDDDMPDENGGTEIPYTPPEFQAVLGLAKQASITTEVAENTFSTQFTFRLENFGNAAALGVNIQDDLALTFAAVEAFEVESGSLASDQFTVDPGFDGVSNQSLLAGADSIEPGAFGEVSFVVLFQVSIDSGLVVNVAQATQTTGPPDDSTDGDNPDPNDDGVPDEDEGTSVEYDVPIARPLLGIAKQANQAIQGADGSFVSTITLTVENFGNGPARNVQVVDALQENLASATNVSVVPGSLQSTLFTVNADFNGDSVTSLLVGTDELAAGAVGIISFDVSFTVLPETVGLTNIATVTAEDSPPDDSTPGDDPDPNGDDVPDENGSTEIPFEPPVFAAQLGIAKQASVATPVSDTEFVSEFILVVENFGNATAVGLNIEDDLKSAFTTAVDFFVVPGSLASNDFAVNPGFNGADQTQLLQGTDSLIAGGTGQVSFSVQFEVSAQTNSLLNLATVTGANSPPDNSTPGNDPDPNDDDVPNENGGTEIPYTPPEFDALLGLAKQASAAERVGEGTYQSTFTFVLENFGNGPALAVNISDDLATTFASAVSFEVQPDSLQSDDFVVNTNFNGVGDTLLLDGSDDLDPGQRGAVSFTVIFEATSETGEIVNFAVATGGNSPPDKSTPGNDPDPNNDDVPDEKGDTRVPYDPPEPAIALVGLAKAASDAVPSENNGFVTTLDFLIVNMGATPLTQLSLTDDLRLTFPEPATFSVVPGSLRSADLTVNAQFDGIDAVNLLSGADTLAVGAQGAVTLDVEFMPMGLSGPFFNSARVTTAEGVEDTSTDGTLVDPGGNGEPEEEEPTPIMPMSNPSIGLSKTVSSIEPIEQGYRVTFSLHVVNNGDVALSEVQVTDDLRVTFPTPIRIENISEVQVSGALEFANGAYDLADVRLLGTDQSLAPGDTGSISFSVEVSLDGQEGPFTNQAIASGIGPTGSEVSDLSHDGVDPTTPGNTPTPIVLPGGVRGTVFLDVDHDRELGEMDQRLTDWSIELLDDDLAELSEIRTDDEGNYNLSDLPPGDYYIQFRHPVTDVVWGRVPVRIVAGQVAVINLPVDPQGVVYDAQAREILPTTRVGLSSGGVPLPEQCLLPNQQNQPVGPNGFYRFVILHGADQACPNEEAIYRLAINEVPAGYTPGIAASIEAQLGDFNLVSCSSPCLIQPQNGAPAIDIERPEYFETYVASSSTQIMINNHLPVDRAFTPAPNPVNAMLDIDVRPNRNTVRVGSVVGYTITVTNRSNIDAPDLAVVDVTAPGLQALDDTAQLVRPGSDGVFGTQDDVVRDLIATGAGPIVFDPFPLDAGEQAQIRFVARVGGSTAPGVQPNTSSATEDFSIGTETVRDRAQITVIADPLLHKATLLGKVFLDRDGDGEQTSNDDWQEKGLPGVRLITPEGLIIETDAHGRFHLADIDVPDTGGHYVIKLDTFSLPENSTVISDLRQIVRLTPGGIAKVSFAVKNHRRDTDCCGEFEKLYVTDPFAASKKLDVNLLGISKAPAQQQRDYMQLGFEVFSNYYRQARSFELRVGEWREGKLHSISRKRHCFVMDSERQMETVQLPVGEYTQLGYSLRAYADEQGCNDKSQMYDDTHLQIIDLRGFDIPAVVNSRPAGQSILSRQSLSVDSAYRDLRIHRRENTSEAAESLLNKQAHFAEDPLAWRVDPTDNSDTEHLKADQKTLEVNFDWQGVNNSEREAVAEKLKDATLTIGKDYAFELEGADQRKERLIVHSSLANRDGIYRFEFELDGANRDSQAHYQIALYSDQYSDTRPIDSVCMNTTSDEKRSVEFTKVDLGEQETVQLVVQLYDGPTCEVIPGTRLTRVGLIKPDRASYLADETTAYMDCCEIPTALRTFLDDNNEVTTIRVDNLAGMLAPLERRSVRISITSPDTAQGTPRSEVLGPNQSVELYLGDFLDGPVSTADWSVLHVHLFSQHIQGEMYYEIKRERGEDDTYWRPPTITAHCFDVAATPIIENEGVSAINHVNTEVADPRVGDPLTSVDYGVAVVDLTVGGYNQSGDFKSALRLDGLHESSYVDGRIAGYWRGRKPSGSAQGKDFTWTVQVDSSKDELSNLWDNLKREDPRRLFRQLDADQYYPTYGDDSTIIDDTNSQGAFYAKVGYGDSEALWGNYNTGFTSTEFSQYNRSLYGLKANYAAGDAQRDGSHQFDAQVFGSQAQSVLGHAQFHATGGSLYYLRHTDIVMGSEKIWIEVRRRDSEQLEERQALVAGRDYEIDPLQGRILLQRPLAQIMRDRHNSVIQASSLDGDRVYLLVDYEYVPVGFGADDYVYGARLQGWMGSDFVVGFTHVNEEQGSTDYQLTGVDAVLHLGSESYVSAEYADSESARLGSDFASLDGGLTFDPRNSIGVDQDGRALGMEAYLDLADFSEYQGQLKLWWKERASGYSSSAFALGPTTEDMGLDIIKPLGDHWVLSASASELERQGVQRTQAARVQMSYKSCAQANTSICTYLDLEARQEDNESLVSSSSAWRPYVGDASLYGVRVGRDITTNTTLYASAQASTDQSRDYQDNDRGAVGLNATISDNLALSIEASDGDRGEALIAGIDYTADGKASFNVSSGVGRGALTQFATRYHLSEGQELYGSYRVDPDRSDTERNMLTFGQRSDLGRRTRIFTEAQFGKEPRQASSGHVLGLEYDASEDWVIASTITQSSVDRRASEFERVAVSLGASYASETRRFSIRGELREDDGPGTDLVQYVLTSALTQKLDDTNRLLAKLNLAWVDDELDSRDLSRFVEFDLGYAYRPVINDRLNFIARYGYLMDVGTAGQLESLGDERSHVLSMEGIYDINKRLEIGGKLAGRQGKSRLEKGQGHWFDMATGLALARVTWRLPNEESDNLLLGAGLEVVGEYRWLKDFEAETLKQGALLGIYKQIDARRFDFKKLLEPSIRLGVGFNFSGFDDDMRHDSYKAHGWFIDMMAVF